MNARTVGQDAARRIDEAVMAGRLPAKPDLAVLSRIAAIVSTVLNGGTAPRTNKTAKGSPTSAVSRRARHDRTHPRR
jgi:hypothetical protein